MMYGSGGNLLDLGGLNDRLGDSGGGLDGLDLLHGGGCSNDFRVRHYGRAGTTSWKVLGGRERKMGGAQPDNPLGGDRVKEEGVRTKIRLSGF
ncbi:hypothetical protein C8R44DRAFT_282325 [Mycena epipterygia]|nr:hypothetical protein C8R44DRAFT_282325 [Mycena epipterygia]